MLKNLATLLLSMLLICGVAAKAEPYRRLVNFEWEQIEGAKSYDIDLTQVKKEGETGKPKTFSFRTKESIWNGRLTPGKYMMKLRARDYRGVPGDWSEPSEFNVGLDNVNMKSPAPKSTVPSNEEEKTNLEFRWDPVGGADQYAFELTSDDGKTKISEIVKEPKFKTSVPVANSYTWKVTAQNSEGISSDATSVSQFTVTGKPLAPPAIVKPESMFVREIKWSRPDYIKEYEVIVVRANPATKKWEKVRTYENYTADSLPFDSSWEGGKYQILIRAKSDLRPASQQSKIMFDVRDGDRSAAAEYTALVRRSIEKTNGWYAIASYLVTDMKYSGTNPEKNSQVAYDAFGGTGRVGLGWNGRKSPWGFLTIADLSGFTINGEIRTFASLEANAVYKQPVGDRAELRYQMGLFYKELPETIGDPFTGVSQNEMVSAIGPHGGVEYWYSLTPKWGVQLNAHVYASVAKVSTPNGQDISPSISTQFGILGSYRFSDKFTGLMGYARREDRMSYKAVPSTTNFALDGDVNESVIVGNYINFFAEWSF
ncbi:hypothetical protein B9G69_003810 [Bdellovibrio sp. SKB1291214]|uniref:hypothetical protein n=1 Tax=Bdellovibrio sp. SKB1291214 TaxID=1732569 RepID=UPI0020CFD0B6|nr:hypothetical protein [Bdellovibrio sp. SKB1291214]UYL09699.1 hypothetical protein B9G69_003810 [Bdellovibrio sp. SKB1291214]